MRPAYVSQLRRYQAWLSRNRGLDFQNYEALWQWSVGEPNDFWQSLWDYHGMTSPTPHSAALAEERMPGAVWFPGAQVNYAREVFRHVDAATAAGMPAIIAENEEGAVRETSWTGLRRDVAAFALTLRDLGVTRGDRVAAYMPNRTETIVAFLATISIGAVWSVCAPDMGPQAVIDRFRQIGPCILIAVDGIHYGGRAADRSAMVETLRAELPSVERVILLRTPYATGTIPADADFAASVAREDAAADDFEPEWLPFDHPLWVLFSSGTTGMPKAMVHSHGGVLMAGFAGSKNVDVGCSYEENSFGERFHWFSTTGWVMWNAQVGGLVSGTTICIYDGSPNGPKGGPDWTTLWRFAARHGVTYFGAGAAFYGACMKAGIGLAACGDLARIRALGTTGSPLPPAVQEWGTRTFAALGTPDIWWSNISGGTDFCANLVSGNRDLPLQPGRMQCRQLGSAVAAWNDAGEPVIGEMGELVCTRPLPSMPLYFLNDPDGERYRSSYFDVFPGVWRHGDWIRIDADGTCVIFGRSDATINRHGVRLGTSEIYSAVEKLPDLQDSMLVDLEYLGRDSCLVLFVVPREGTRVDDCLRQRIGEAIRSRVSPRFLPDRIIAAPSIPYTLSGKKLEIPVRRLLLGHPADKVASRDALADPGALDWYAALAASGSFGQDAAGNPA
ncbi:acetoacetate--CoA ligase [Oceanibacterium hippocampi]|uniref:Acetyl-coenzyme A synthetase n=1 Tax=Oceanibacterium hippocampi TaxID=745714 RepID=A0A1Y5TK98_9PROT|nr:acetoacetate--CoA ligase [Oceanibacterium hippocampi]SLN62404.1 Acetyl-coenzyme A synthetase [Oceanibacterium hippocampi]